MMMKIDDAIGDGARIIGEATLEGFINGSRGLILGTVISNLATEVFDLRFPERIPNTFAFTFVCTIAGFAVGALYGTVTKTIEVMRERA